MVSLFSRIYNNVIRKKDSIFHRTRRCKWKGCKTKLNHYNHNYYCSVHREYALEDNLPLSNIRSYTLLKKRNHKKMSKSIKEWWKRRKSERQI